MFEGKIIDFISPYGNHYKGIINGVIDLSMNQPGGVPSHSTCPFGQ